jgi:hypothetical protein
MWRATIVTGAATTGRGVASQHRCAERPPSWQGLLVTNPGTGTARGDCTAHGLRHDREHRRNRMGIAERLAEHEHQVDVLEPAGVPCVVRPRPRNMLSSLRWMDVLTETLGGLP